MIGPLTWSVVAPLGLAAAMWLLPRRGGAVSARWFAMLGSLVPLAVGLAALVDFAQRPGADYRMLETYPWSVAIGASWTVGVDGMGAAMLALSGLISVIATISAWKETRHPRAYHACVLLLLAAMNGVFVTLDLLVFYVCWEVMLVPMLVLIGVWGAEQRRYAALKFFVYTLAGSVLMLAMLIALWHRTPPGGRVVEVDRAVVQAYATNDGTMLHGLAIARSAPNAVQTVIVPRNFDIRHLSLQWRSWEGERFLGLSLAAFGFIAVLLACLVKVPAVPLHTWLPHAHVQAPTAVSVLLAGVLLKLGVFGLYRIAWPMFPHQAILWAPAIGIIGVAGILWAAWVALGQQDLKRMVAYSSVSHMGWCLLGLAGLTIAGVTGGMAQAVAHGLGSSLLFLLVGVVYDRAHHRRIDGFGGLAGPMPRFAWILLIAALAGAGLPGLSGFIGEFMALSGSFTAGGYFPLLATLAVISVVMSAAYFLWMVKRIAYGPIRVPEQAHYADCDARELAATLPLVALIVLIGVWPTPLIDALRPSCEALIAHVRSAL
ncbi:MAG: NADH-quinone oxidoreductase subunit M [Planctomycetota bacterium]